MTLNSIAHARLPALWATLFLVGLITVSGLAELLVGSAPVLLSVNGQLHVLPSITAPEIAAQFAQEGLLQGDWVLWPLIHTQSTFDTAAEGGVALLEWWVYATRAAVLATGVIAITATTLGLMCGWAAAVGPSLFAFLLRHAVALSAGLPSLVLLGVVRVSNGLPAGLDLIVVLIILRSIEAAHLVRTLVVSLSDRDFIAASRVVGTAPMQVLRWHLWPHLARPLASLAATTLVSVVGLEAALSLVGLGLPAAQASWGSPLPWTPHPPLTGAAWFALLSVVATSGALFVLARQVQSDRWVQRHHL